jgi:hypothetical protein
MVGKEVDLLAPVAGPIKRSRTAITQRPRPTVVGHCEYKEMSIKFRGRRTGKSKFDALVELRVTSTFAWPKRITPVLIHVPPRTMRMFANLGVMRLCPK